MLRKPALRADQGGRSDCRLKLAKDAQRLSGQAAESPGVFHQVPAAPQGVIGGVDIRIA